MQIFKIVKKIGEGTNNQVFEAYLKDGAHCALKVSKRQGSRFEDMLSELTVTKFLEATNIVSLLGFMIKIPALIYPIYSGDLYHLRLDWTPAEIKTHVLMPLLKALKYIHSCGFVHCDIKPDNVFVDVNGVVKLGDLGAARRVTGNEYEFEVGAWPYRAPELFLKTNGWSAKIDCWALGCLIYFCYTKETPFKGETEREMIKNQDCVPEAAGDFKVLMARLKLLEKDPKDRSHAGKALIFLNIDSFPSPCSSKRQKIEEYDFEKERLSAMLEAQQTPLPADPITKVNKQAWRAMFHLLQDIINMFEEDFSSSTVPLAMSIFDRMRNKHAFESRRVIDLLLSCLYLSCPLENWNKHFILNDIISSCYELSAKVMDVWKKLNPDISVSQALRIKDTDLENMYTFVLESSGGDLLRPTTDQFAAQIVLVLKDFDVKPATEYFLEISATNMTLASNFTPACIAVAALMTGYEVYHGSAPGPQLTSSLLTVTKVDQADVVRATKFRDEIDEEFYRLLEP